MFVIVQTWDNVEKGKKSQEELFAATMGRAGVAITVTSLTDLLAFAVGATTV